MKIKVSLQGGGPQLAAVASTLTTAATAWYVSRTGGLAPAESLQLAATTASGNWMAFYVGSKV